MPARVPVDVLAAASPAVVHVPAAHRVPAVRGQVVPVEAVVRVAGDIPAADRFREAI